jgi:hypothetical protein
MRSLPQIPEFHHLLVQNRPNKRRSSHHNVVFSGDFALTFSKTDGEDDLPRFSHFRHNYASSVQLNLFSPEERASEVEVSLDGAERIYGVICHGPDPRNSAHAGHIRIQFPSASAQSPVLATPLDLLAEYRQLLDTQRPSVVEVVAAEPRLKIVRSEEESSS